MKINKKTLRIQVEKDVNLCGLTPYISPQGPHFIEVFHPLMRLSMEYEYFIYMSHCIVNYC